MTWLFGCLYFVRGCSVPHARFLGSCHAALSAAPGSGQLHPALRAWISAPSASSLALRALVATLLGNQHMPGRHAPGRQLRRAHGAAPRSVEACTLPRHGASMRGTCGACIGPLGTRALPWQWPPHEQGWAVKPRDSVGAERRGARPPTSLTGHLRFGIASGFRDPGGTFLAWRGLVCCRAARQEYKIFGGQAAKSPKIFHILRIWLPRGRSAGTAPKPRSARILQPRAERPA